MCHFRASKLIFIVSWVMMMTACVSFQGLKAHLYCGVGDDDDRVSWVMMMTACVSFQGLKAHIYCVMGDDDDRMCVISGPQSSSLLCRG